MDNPVAPPAGEEEAPTAAERKHQELEAQLRQAQKMEVVGRLAGGVAHDFNNLLTIILGYCELLQTELAPETPWRLYVNEIQKAAVQATSVARQLLAFSSKQVFDPKVLDLNMVVADMQNLLRRLISEHIHLEISLAADLGHVQADRGQLEQVLMNLVINARDAMPQGGKITITTSNIDLTEATLLGRPVTGPGPHVRLAVSDTGCGMSAETQAHVFEPFFTTKEKGKGTGLGLATVYSIVTQSGGYLDFHSEVDHGSTFVIYLPRVEGVVEPSARPQAGARPLRGSETVLLAEDEPELRSMLERVLRHYGYTVLAAASTHEALSLCLQQYPRPIHLLVTDVVMPDMSGYALAARVLPLQRGIKVLYISGYADETIVQHGVLEPATAFLQKPFTGEALARKVRAVLEQQTLGDRQDQR